MAVRSSKTVYQLIEKHLQDSETPLTCVDLMEFPDLRQAALDEYGSDIQQATNKLSDALGFMWRRDLLDRYTNHDVTSKARFAYGWARPKSPPPLSFDRKPEMKITEKDGKVIIDLQNITITITTKGT